MYVNEDHCLSSAHFLPSPHANQRPDVSDISLLVIHNISLPPGHYAGNDVIDFFLGKLNFSSHPTYEDLRDLRVSAHLFLRRDGSIYQFVPFNQRAWHAGISSYHGRENCNDYSIGIEVEGSDDVAYEDVQYQVLAEVTKALFECYPLMTKARIAGHADIAPERKTDPGPAFDWNNYLARLD